MNLQFGCHNLWIIIYYENKIKDVNIWTNKLGDFFLSNIFFQCAYRNKIEAPLYLLLLNDINYQTQSLTSLVQLNKSTIQIASENLLIKAGFEIAENI